MDGIRVFAGSGRRLGDTQEDKRAQEERDRLLAEQLQAEIDEENANQQIWEPPPSRHEAAFQPFQSQTRHAPPRAHLEDRPDPIADILRANQRRQEAAQQIGSHRGGGEGLWGQRPEGKEYSTPIGEPMRGRQSPWGGQAQQGAPSTARMPANRDVGGWQSEEDTIYGNRGSRGAYSRTFSSPHRQQPTRTPERWKDMTQEPPPHHQADYQEPPHPEFQQGSKYPENHEENPGNPENYPDDSEHPEHHEGTENEESSYIPGWAEGFIPPNLPPKFRLAMFGVLVVGCLLFAVGLSGIIFRWLHRSLAPAAGLAGLSFIAAALAMFFGVAWSWYDERAEGVRLLAERLEDEVMQRMDRGAVGIHDVYVDLREEYGRGNEARFDQAWAKVTETLRNKPGVVLHNLPGTNRKAWKRRERFSQGTP